MAMEASSVAMERVLHMKGGEGEASYANTSSLPRKVILKVKPILEDSIKQMMLRTTFRNHLNVVDLGCSSGSNTLMVVSNIMNTIDNTCLSLNHKLPTFQIYLNDLFENDFNSIFKLLPDFYKTMQQERGDKDGTCYINATPGSFYGRLFPNNHINLFHSSYCLHWLSQAPKDSTNRGEPLIKGNIYLSSTSPPSVFEAYFKQFERDFKLFLKSRSEELIPGGIMVLTIVGREKACHINSCPAIIGLVLNDMVQEGLVEEAKLDFFDMPLYGPTVEEVRQVIEEEGSFTLQALETFKIAWNGSLEEDTNNFVLDNNMIEELIVTPTRAIFEPLLEVVFGKDIMDDLFSRLSKKIAQNVEFLTSPQSTNIVLSMTKVN